MDTTRDPNADVGLFERKAEEYLETNNIPPYASPHEAVGLIAAGDQLVDIYLGQLSAEGTTYSDELILQLGSAIGQVYRLVFAGEWRFSEEQEQWIVRIPLPDNAFFDVNVFHKLRKRFDNGMEDSILYQYEMIRKMLLEGIDATS